MLLELLAVLAATCTVLYYRFRRKCNYWYASINKCMLWSKNPFPHSKMTYVEFQSYFTSAFWTSYVSQQLQGWKCQEILRLKGII